MPAHCSAARAFTVLLASLPLAACPQPFSVWLHTGGVAPVFAVSNAFEGTKAVKVSTFSIVECYRPDSISDRVYWSFQREKSPESGISNHPLVGERPHEPSADAKLHLIEYGKVPRGYATITAARRLKASGCFIAEARGKYTDAVYFVTTARNEARAADGFVVDSMFGAASQPIKLPDPLKRHDIRAPLDAVIAATKEILAYHGLMLDSSLAGESQVRTFPTPVPFVWEGKRIDQRVDCGLFPEGLNQVLLPISVTPQAGYGRLLIKVDAQVTMQAELSRIRLEPKAIFHPPWYERGDRPSMDCGLQPGFVGQLLREIDSAATQ